MRVVKIGAGRANVVVAMVVVAMVVMAMVMVVRVVVVVVVAAAGVAWYAHGAGTRTRMEKV